MDAPAEFSRETILAVVELLESVGHSDFTRLLLRYGLEGTEANKGKSLRDRANHLAQYLLHHRDALDTSERDLRGRIVREAVEHFAQRLDVDFGGPSNFDEAYPALAGALASDGFVVQHGQVHTRDSLGGDGAPSYTSGPSATKERIPVPNTVSIFISHSSKDQDYVRLLIHLLRSALNLPASQIRCTSVDGYRLPAGATTTEQLRNEIHGAQAFIGVISPHSLRSLYVVFELGARWGARKHLIPLLLPGARHDLLAAPLGDLNALEGGNPAQLHQLIQDLATTLSITSSSPAAYHEQLEAIQRLPIQASGEEANEPFSPDSASSAEQVIRSLSAEGRQILAEAVKAPDPSILCIVAGNGLHVQVNQTVLTVDTDHRAKARWKGAIRQLESLGLIEDQGDKGEVFELTDVGWEISDHLDTTQ
jgi:hypothetical protein